MKKLSKDIMWWGMTLAKAGKIDESNDAIQSMIREFNDASYNTPKIEVIHTLEQFFPNYHINFGADYLTIHPFIKEYHAKEYCPGADGKKLDTVNLYNITRSWDSIDGENLHVSFPSSARRKESYIEVHWDKGIPFFKTKAISENIEPNKSRKPCCLEKLANEYYKKKTTFDRAFFCKMIQNALITAVDRTIDGK